MKREGLIVRGVMLELWRRQDAWILLMLMGIYALVALAARVGGIETPASGTFMLNLGLSLAGIFAHAFTVLLAVRQFPQELENRTLYPLLAKPLTRGSLVFGKWIACALGGGILYVLLFLVAWFASPHMESYMAGTLVQHLLLQPFSLAWASALAIALSLLLPRGLALLGALLVVFTGDMLVRWGLEYSLLANLFPRFGTLNLATRYTDGIGPLNAETWLRALAYVTTWCGACLVAARALFARRPL